MMYVKMQPDSEKTITSSFLPSSSESVMHQTAARGAAVGARSAGAGPPGGTQTARGLTAGGARRGGLSRPGGVQSCHTGTEQIDRGNIGTG